MSFDIQHKFLGKVKSYDFLGVSVWRAAPCSKTKPCVDTIPNRYPLLRYDFTPPTVYLGKVPLVSTLVSNTLTFPVSFKVKDDHVGSGLRSWTLQQRPYGDTTWTNVKKGTSTAAVVQVTAVEGAILDLRVVAVDRQGNREVQGIGRAAVPMDDRNAAIGYSVPPTQTARPNAFLGTISGIANGETVTFSVNLTGAGSTDVCVIGGPPATAATTAGATYAVDGGPTGGALTELASTPDLQDMLCLGMSSGAHTLVITGTTAEPFVVDGFYIAP